MSDSFLEHVNITAADPEKTAKTLCQLFGWDIRWQGDAISGGTSIHVGEKQSYIAIYAPPTKLVLATNPYETLAGLNHIGVVVDDLDEVEKRVIDVGYKSYNHGDYEPGRRFYFREENNIEFEVVSYK